MSKVKLAWDTVRILGKARVAQYIRWSIGGILAAIFTNWWVSGIIEVGGEQYLWPTIYWLIFFGLGLCFAPGRYWVIRLSYALSVLDKIGDWTSAINYTLFRDTYKEGFYGTRAEVSNGTDRKGRPRISYPKLMNWNVVRPGYLRVNAVPPVGRTVDDVVSSSALMEQRVKRVFGGDAILAMEPSGASATMHLRWGKGLTAQTPAELFMQEHWPATAVRLGMAANTFDGDRPQAVIKPLPGQGESYSEGFELTLVPRPGIAAGQYLHYDGGLKSITGLSFVHSRSDGLSVTYDVSRTLFDPFPAIIPFRRTEDVDHRALPIGQTVDGTQAVMPVVGLHTRLVAESGSGKGSVMWSALGNLAGRNDTTLLGVDLKGGQELGVGEHIFSAPLVTDIESFAVAIIEMADALRERQAYMKEQKMREFKSSPELPLVLMVIDESHPINRALGRLDAGTTQMLNDAMDDILEQGRASGFILFTCMQSPLKSDFKWADRFGNTIALKMANETHQVSALGPGSIETVGELWKYDTDEKGTERGRGVVRYKGKYTEFKSYYPNDETIANFPAAVNQWDR